MTWSGGYPTDRRYPDTLQPAMAPAAMDAALLVAGLAPPRDGPRFRYLELGCGTATTLAALAALHPEAEFEGHDFLPEHVARARAFAAEAGLDNLRVEETSFAELAAAPPGPPVDYAALHGVWTWVAPAERAHLVTILGRRLKPGGVACLGYNAAAGWGELEPLRRILRDAPPGPADAPFAPARAAAEAWLAFAEAPRVAEIWRRLAKAPEAYLMHEMLSEHAAAWPAEVAAALAPAKLARAAPAQLEDAFDGLAFRGPALAFVRAAAAAGWGETARDIAARRTFRTDLFSRGAPRLSAAERDRRLRALRLAPWPPRLAAEREALAAAPDRPGFEPALAARAAEALAAGETTLGGFADRLGLAGAKGLQAALLCVARGEARLLAPPEAEAAAAPGAARFAAAAARRLRDRVAVPGLPAPRLLEPAILAGVELEALLLGAPAPEGVAEGLARLGLPEPPRALPR